MITILIANDEKRIKKILADRLKQEGYNISNDSDGDGDAIRIMGKESIKNTDTLKDRVIELENNLYDEKKGVLYKTILDEIEKPLIEHVLERTEGNQLKAAKVLGINRNTMRTKIRKLAIDINKWKR